MKIAAGWSIPICLLSSVAIAQEDPSSVAVTLTSPDTEYRPGHRNTFAFNVAFTQTGAEYADRFQFVFPAAITIVSGTPASGTGACASNDGIQTICAPNISWTRTTVPCSGAFAPTGCGAYIAGTRVFTVTVDIPADYDGPLPVTLNTSGDGFGSPPHSDTDTLTLECGECWTPVDSLTTPRSRNGVAFFPPTGHFFVLGGEATGSNRAIPIEEYDPVLNTWTDRTNLTTGVSNTGAATVGALIYVPGGYTGVAAQSLLQIFNPGDNSISLGPSMPAVNQAHAVVARGQFVHVLGGSDTGFVGTTHFIYDTVAGSWGTGAATPFSTRYAGAASDGTYVYLVGGYSDGNVNLGDVQRYNPAANSWSPVASLIAPRAGLGAFFGGGRLWAVGGGWTSYLTSTETNHKGASAAWAAGPSLVNGMRTLGAAFGNHLALKAGGWNGNYSGAAEVLDFEIFSDGFELNNLAAWSFASP